MSSGFNSLHVKDVLLTEQRGVRFSNIVPPKAVTNAGIEVEIGLEKDPLGSRVRSKAQVRVIEKDDSEGAAIYEGEVVVYLRRTAESPEPDGPDLAAIAWPYVRVGLMEQAHRMGVSGFRLPPFLDPEKLPPSEDPEE